MMSDKLPKLDVAKVFSCDAEELLIARDRALTIHGTRDIRAAGNEVEMAVRDYLARTLPTKYHVTHGHLIDRTGITSNQLDIIISDNLHLPALMRSRDESEYVPFDSIYAFGEIKTSYDSARHQVEAFSDVLKKIRTQLHRDLVENTAYKGQIRGDTLLRDTVLSCKNKYLNQLFTFMVFVDGGDFYFGQVSDFLRTTAPEYLPNLIILLDKGVVVYAAIQDDRFSFDKYPEFCDDREKSWCFCPMPGMETSRLEGNHLAFLYYCLVDHLDTCFLEPTQVMQYLQPMFVGRKSQTIFSEEGAPTS